MSDSPLVSVCIPTFNAAAYLLPCLQSAVAQTYPTTEILICDDGSTDSTLEIIKEFQQEHSQIRLVQNDTGPGMVNNWNFCIEQAHGNWIKFLFQDDLLEPDCVEKMLAACRQQNVPVALCRRDFIVHDNVLKHIKRDFSEGGIPKAEDVFGPVNFVSPEQLANAVATHLLTNFLGEPTCYFFHKSILQKTRAFNPDLKQLVDYEFIIRLGLLEGLAFVSQTLAHFRVHASSQSSANNQRDKAVRKRNIAAELGDSLLLLHTYLTDPAFEKIKQAAGEDVLQLYLNHYYQSVCKREGSRLVNEALQPLREQYPLLGGLRYGFFKYVYFRKKYKALQRKNEIKTVNHS